ncbi:hypothetical protein K6119_10460 [Paracrocinitomix mangrovi]|uniref:hypothetical protein n=1 Tax=Paracrocinitomix mangrovi TaxID=2862509 RepID=UPI001C8CF768|nr:hypothetical protein [Paracrocinitomix mangrovi]UKN00156.1 hypothetical protein K6119_10460 [Paracrocinitomix mangrovi]
MRQALIFILLFSTQLLYAQLDKPVIGPEYNTAKKENFSGFLGESDIGLFTADYVYYSKRKQELNIRQFHKTDLQLVSSNNIYSEIEDGYSNDPSEIFFQNNRFFLFSKLQSDRDKTQLLALEVFNSNCERINKVILDTIETEEVSYIEEAQDKKGFILAKHLKYTQLIEQEIALLKIDEEGNISWDKVIKSPMALKNLRIEKIAFKSNQTVYLLCNYAFDLGQGGSQQLNNQYALWAYNNKMQFLKEFEIRIKDKYINGVDIKINQDNHLLMSGYFNETKNPSIAGVFSLIIGDKLKVIHDSWNKYNADVMAKFFNKDDRNKDKELENYVFKDIQLLDDGSFFTIGEQYYKYIERNYDPRTNITTTTEHYNYNSIIVSYFTKEGEYKWTERVSKSQNSTNDYGYFSSFVALNSGKELYLFFNDSKKNNEDPPENYFDYDNLFNNRRFQISYAHINTKGIVNRTGLLDEDYDYMLRAKLSGQINPESMYLITESNRSSKIVKVAVKN